MEDETRDIKQNMKETNLKNDLRNAEPKTNLEHQLAQQKNSDESHSEKHEKWTANDGKKNIEILFVDPLDAAPTEKIDLEMTGLKNKAQTSKNLELQKGRAEVIRLYAASNNTQQALEKSPVSNLTNVSPKKSTYDTYINEVTENVNLESKAGEFQKGRVELIRLQAIANNAQQTLEKSSVRNLTDVAPEKSTSVVYMNEDMDIITNEADAASQGEYILASDVPMEKVPMYITPNTEKKPETTNGNVGSDLLLTAISSILENLEPTYQQIMLDVHTPSIQEEKTADASEVKEEISWASTSLPSSSIIASECATTSSALYQTSSSETSNVLQDFQNIDDTSSISSPQTMERFITADNQFVYGYKDSNGEMHFFSPTISDRETHNEKERKRRSRISESCSALRKIIPGINEKTDKATVFEQTAKYLKFLRDKFGTQYDQIYIEKFYQGRK